VRDDDEGATPRNLLAVSGLCLLTPRHVFEALGGFDEDCLADAYHDLDYCFRLSDRGYRSVCAPGKPLVLRRQLSADLVAHPTAEACFRRRHAARVDPYPSPNMTLQEGRWQMQPRRLAQGFGRPIRALMCSFNLNREGAPYSQFEMTLRLRESGVIDPVVFCPEDGPLRQHYQDHGIDVRVAPHPLSGVLDSAGFDRAIAAFAAFAREQRAELVYANTVHTFYAIAAAAELGLPSVWNPRESEPWQSHFAHFGPAVARRALECFRHPYRVVFVAEATRQVYAPLESEGNFTVVHNGLDRARLEAERDRWSRDEARRSLGLLDELVVLLLGTICERKGQEDLPLALAGLPEPFWPRVRCLIVGDRGLPYSRRVHAACKALPGGLRARVAILPETADTARFYRAADIFVCTSRVESYPRVTLEAMAHGLPLVTTPAFGIREQVREGINALFYAPGDTSGLLGALLRLIQDQPLRERMAKQSRAVLDCLNDFDTMSQMYAAIFREAYLSRGEPVPVGH
jgi:glycosyltransferase involved in cell wall biosynthesis